MLTREMVVDETIDTQDNSPLPMQRLSRSDVHFPLTSLRKRAPSITSLADVSGTEGQTVGRLTIRGKDLTPVPEERPMFDDEDKAGPGAGSANTMSSSIPQFSIEDLPPEVQSRILDFIFGEVHSVNTTTTSLNGTSVSHSMRHPRRKAVSELALVSEAWRELVQERIYRHIKIKGTKSGLAESEEYFCNHMHLTRYIRHIEFWVPVWGDKAASLEQHNLLNRYNQMGGIGNTFADESLMAAHELLGFNFKLSTYSATLSEIFAHINCFFPEARIFTLEGGHCKKSNMIRHFPKLLFPNPNQRLDTLPNIRTFAMRGAWNVMRNYDHWTTIEKALPNVEEWHCGYAKPRQEAYTTINEILLRLPLRLKLRHLSISLDGMYSKDDSTLSSNSLSSGLHLCEQLGRLAPHLESLSYTGKICECFWKAAGKEVLASHSSSSSLSSSSRNTPTLRHSRLQRLEIVVKSCCRQRIIVAPASHCDNISTITNLSETSSDPSTSSSSSSTSSVEPQIEEVGGIMADGAGITNLVFIRSFERLVLSTVDHLPSFPLLDYVRIRYIDLDSPCALLNPYWYMHRGKVNGIWNEEIVERLEEVRMGTSYEELGDGLLCHEEEEEDDDDDEGDEETIRLKKLRQQQQQQQNSTNPLDWRNHTTSTTPMPGLSTALGGTTGGIGGGLGGAGNMNHGGGALGIGIGIGIGGTGALYPKRKPKSIKTSSYRIIAEARGP